MKLHVEHCLSCLLAVILLLFAGPILAADRAYDPLAVTAQRDPATLDLTVNDAARGRAIPIRVYLPASTAPAPVVLFSHGLGGSRQGSAYLGRHWAVRGYVAVFLQHPGSDAAVWQEQPATQRMTALRQAADLNNFLRRVKDAPAVLDQLERWNQSGDPAALAGRLDLRRVGMSGHSFGAITTQAVSGQVAARGAVSFTDTRIKAAIAFSPSRPRRGDPRQAFSRVAIPWLLMTGTQDIALIGDSDMASRLAVFPALPPGGKYELVLYEAEHSAFTERALPGDRGLTRPSIRHLPSAPYLATGDSAIPITTGSFSLSARHSGMPGCAGIARPGCGWMGMARLLFWNRGTAGSGNDRAGPA
jgi:predicted dienelactone hydrolase